jgi:hypothetical protein
MSDNIVEFIPKEEWDRTLSAEAQKDGPIKLTKELNRRRVVSAFMDAFELVGGTPRLVSWADENYTDFIKLYARLMPSQSAESLPGESKKVLQMVLPKTALDE